MPLERRTRATLRRAEFGFLGVWVNTRVHTPRRWGAPLRAGVLAFVGLDCRPLRTSCWMVGTQTSRAMRASGLREAPTGPQGAPVPRDNSTGPPARSANRAVGVGRLFPAVIGDD